MPKIKVENVEISVVKVGGEECARSNWGVRELRRQIIVECAMRGITNRIFVSRYQLYLPDKKQDLCLGIKNPVGLSPANLRYAFRFFELYSLVPQVVEDNGDGSYLQQLAEDNAGADYMQQLVADNVVPDLTKVPWGHHIVIIGKSKGDCRASGARQRRRRGFLTRLDFYHLKSRRYLVIELKAVNFKPEHIGQLGFYMVAVDRQLKNAWDAPTVGLVLCRDGNRTVVEYALSVTDKPMGVAKCRLTQKTPRELSSMKRAVARLGTIVDETIADVARQSTKRKGGGK